MDRCPARRSRPYMMAMVLGTALTAMAPNAVHAEGETASAVADLSRYCSACWRNARLPLDTWNDCTQDVLCRLLRTVPMNDWARTLKLESEEHRELVRAVDAVKKRTQRRKRWTSQSLDLVADRRTDRSVRHDRAAVEAVAGELLTPRQQSILRLSFEGWSVHEIGDELSLPPARVSDEKYKAIRKLREHLSEEA